MSRRSGAHPALATVAFGILALPLVVEWVQWRASREGLPEDVRTADTVLVLGCPSRASGALHPLQAWRSEVGARSLSAAAGSRLIFTGGAGPGEVSEADVMARYACDVLGVAPERIHRETTSRTTWQNLEFSLPLLEGGSTIAIASSPVHAWRARRYLARQRPDLAERLVRADDYRFGERWRLKAATLAYDVARSLRLRLGGAPLTERVDLRRLRAGDVPPARTTCRPTVPANRRC
ncbi:MAG: YdcF family protein [Janthinobacterium lividum]